MRPQTRGSGSTNFGTVEGSNCCAPAVQHNTRHANAVPQKNLVNRVLPYSAVIFLSSKGLSSSEMHDRPRPTNAARPATQFSGFTGFENPKAYLGLVLAPRKRHTPSFLTLFAEWPGYPNAQPCDPKDKSRWEIPIPIGGRDNLGREFSMVRQNGQSPELS
jgi:hypothetical protein